MARPPHQRDENTARQVRTMSGLGVSEEHIGLIVGLSHSTVRKHYLHEMECGHIEASAQVEQALFKAATHAEKPNVIACIFWLKARAGWREEGEGLGKKEAAAPLSRVADLGSDWDGLLSGPQQRLNGASEGVAIRDEERQWSGSAPAGLHFARRSGR